MNKFFLKYILSLPIIYLGLNSMDISAQQEIEEIVVSATKRDQSLQDVNIAVNAFNNEDLNQLNWDDITNVANQAPNVDVKYAWGNSMPVYTIRGVGMNSFQASDTASVGLFIDEVFQTSIVSMGAQLYDMERVEVLKGPQSALFGRNTNGGAVNYYSRKPSMESEGFINLDTG
jgi:iron complex outermembrane receptor protein